jgi:hypothetical protein
VTPTPHSYEVRPRKDRRGVDLISDQLPFGRLWYEDASAAVGYAEHFSRSADAVVNVYDEAAFKSIADQAKSAPEKKAKKAA